VSGYFPYDTDKLSEEEFDVTMTEACEFVEELLGTHISLNGIGLDVIRKLADLLKAKFLSIPDNGILVIQTDDMPSETAAAALKKAIGGKPILFMPIEAEASVMDAERAILHILSHTQASIEDRQRMAEVIANSRKPVFGD
jgi:hypothetical protein